MPQVGNLIGDLSALISRLSIPTRIPQIEVAAGDDCVVLVLRILSPLTDADRVALLEFEQQHKVRWLLQPGGPSSLEPLQGAMPQLWYGLPEYGLRMAFEPADFIQVNGAMNRLPDQPGAGPACSWTRQRQCWTCSAAWATSPCRWPRACKHVLGMEGDAGLIARAQANAAANGLANAQFVAVNLAGEDATAALPGPGRAGPVVACAAGSAAHRRPRYPAGDSQAGAPGGWSMSPAIRAAWRGTWGY